MTISKFTKKETLDFLTKFNKNTSILEQPMIAWYDDGAYTLEDALEMVEGGFIPEGIKLCAKRPNEEYWDSVLISKESSGYNVSTDDMSNLPDRNSENITGILKEASALLHEYIS
jgi:hypothetical protein